MQTEAKEVLEIVQETTLTLERQKLDLESVRIQVLLGLSGILLLCLANYFPVLNWDFFSDRIQPFKQIAQAFHGDWHGFIKDNLDNLNGQNLGGNFSPVVSLTLLADFAVWHLRAWGYFLTNIVLCFLGAACVVLVALELSGLKGNRLGAPAAIWAGLLFALHPLNALCVPFLFTREYLLFSLLCLAAILFFLRFQLLRERQYLVSSSLCTFLALSLNEAALTLPVVASLAQLLLNRQPPLSTELSHRAQQLLIDTWPFWTLAAIYAAMTKHNFVSALQFNQNVALMWANLECNLNAPVGYYADSLRMSLIACTAAVAILGTVRLCRPEISWRPYLFLALWAVAAFVAPIDTLHFHHAGGGGFFLATAPVSILLASLALPALDTRGAKNTRAWSALGCAFLAATCVSWSICLQICLRDSMLSHKGSIGRPQM